MSASVIVLDGASERDGPAPRCQDSEVIGAENSAAIVGEIQGIAHRRMIPLNATLELTLKCNIRCLHCYNFDRDQPSASSGCGTGTDARPELSLEELLRVLGELRAAGCLFLTLTGGEILSTPHLFPVLERARELNFAVQLLSNGTMLRPGVTARLAGYRNLLGVSVSLYGATAETHDAITRVRGSWRRTWEGAERLKAAGISVRLKFIVMRQNAAEAEAMRAQATARGFTYFMDVTITSRHDGSDGSLSTRIDGAQLEALYRGALRDLVPLRPRPPEDTGAPCNCARGNCAVSATGDVFPCVSVPWSAGNVRDQSFGEIWRSSPVFQRIRGFTLADYTDCAPCADRAYCSRNRSAAYTASGSYTGVDPFVCSTAALTRKLAEERASVPAARRE